MLTKTSPTNTHFLLGRFAFGAKEHTTPNSCRTLSLSNSFRCMKRIWSTNFNFGISNRSWSTTIQSVCKCKKEAQKRLFLCFLCRSENDGKDLQIDIGKFVNL